MRVNGGDTWYCRLSVPESKRTQAGKTRLIRSLQTTDHSTALLKYGAGYAALEKELQALLQRPSLGQQVETNRSALTLGHSSEDQRLDAREITEAMVGFDLPEPTPEQLEVYQAFKTGKPLPLTWSQAIDVWVKAGDRRNSRPISKGSIAQAKTKIKHIQPFGKPHEMTKQVIRRFIEQRELDVEPVTVKGGLKIYSAILDALCELDYVEHNSFKDIRYVVGQKSTKKSFTDEQIRLLKKEHHPAWCLIQTGMRPGELDWGDHDHEAQVMIIKPVFDKNGKELWRPKTISSERRVPLPTGFTKPKFRYRQWVDSFREVVPDFDLRLHSGRHTFIELSRRADCNDVVIQELTGHGSKKGSESHAAYGDWPDEVLRREAQKVWKLMEEITS